VIFDLTIHTTINKFQTKSERLVYNVKMTFKYLIWNKIGGKNGKND